MMKQLAGQLIDRMAAVAGAVIFTQIPSFMIQYQHQLAGHVSELRYQVNQMRDNAALSGKSLEQLIHKFVSEADPDIMRQGELMQGMAERLERLGHSLLTLHQSSLWGKPFTFIYQLDWEVFSKTLSSYSWTVPFTFEGIIYGFIGIIIGFVSFSFCKRLWQSATVTV